MNSTVDNKAALITGLTVALKRKANERNTTWLERLSIEERLITILPYKLSLIDIADP